MRSMKTLLRLLGAVTLTTVAASSVVACGGDKVKNMNTQVQKDFGFLDTNGNSLVKLKINVDATSKLARWKSDELVGITADKLLNSGGESAKAKSADAANFLVDVLKLKVESGEGKDRMFKHSNATVIALEPKTYSPEITKKSDNTDYVITGGTLTINFTKDSKQFGDDYSLNILGDQSVGITADKLPQASNITLADFNNISGFVIGQPKKEFPVGKDLTQYFKTTDNEGKTVKSIVDLIKKGDLKINVSEAATGSGNFAKDDTIKIKISIGELTFATEYTLTIA